ncbi:uncharacterized protein LOC132708573 [Cylas formicarius]|uniref:uncharacterized protein LOC132708573 n=1 Tax=Cylas formicarius TaxID=197179 RepID=UPI0029589F28|nr:uncharacterized protein LOC132708573 [Cylas formicarius]
MTEKKNYQVENSTPLCVFCLSPPFSIRPANEENTDLAPSRRLDSHFLFSSPIRRKWKDFNRKRSSTNLVKTVAGLFNFRTRKTLNLDEILTTIQSAWKSPENKRIKKSESMESGSGKSSTQTTESCSPILQRRRLSAPETVMRKHVLAQERCHSQDSRIYNLDDYIGSCSDSNLTRKKDSNFIRKSTLLRRLWTNNKSKLTGSYQEWQHTRGKLCSTPSLNSCHSSPEHSSRGRWDSRTSPIRNINSSPKKCPSKSNINSKVPPLRLPPESRKYSRDSTTKYTFSSFTTCSDNSDSAYANSNSNYYSSNIASSAFNDENSNRVPESQRSVQESSVQTQEVTNLNVISNVKLSQKTLDVIFNQIMQEVHELVPGEINISTATISANNNQSAADKISIGTADTSVDDKADKQIHLANTMTSDFETPTSFFLKTEGSSVPSADSQRIKNYILSNIETGSPYSKPTEASQLVVPRFSALPRSSSMEVNTSAGDEDKDESDSASFVDSLEDFNSPRVVNYDEKPVGKSMDVFDLLPEGSTRTSATSVKKSAAFFIPIEVRKTKDVKPVSELLPVKVREKLKQRQQKREEKCQQIKSASGFGSIGAAVADAKTKLSSANSLYRKRSRPVLPKIDLVKTVKIDNSGRKTKSDAGENATRKKGSWSSKARIKSSEPQEYLCDFEHTKTHQKTEYKSTHKRIEILEIMECVEVPGGRSPRDKSKIPIAVHHGQSKKTFDKPVYLDVQTDIRDPKIDQLIANILIDTLNHGLDDRTSEKLNEDAKNKPKSPATGKYLQKFEVIPEELASIQSSSEENGNTNNNNNRDNASEFSTTLSRDKNDNFKNINQESPPMMMAATEDSSCSIPKGWITFYTVRKDAMKTPDSTSDEGRHCRKNSEANENVDTNKDINGNLSRKHDSAKSDATYKVKSASNNDHFPLSSSSEGKKNQMSSGGKFKKSGFQRKGKFRNNDETCSKNSGEWTVTVSGTTTYGQVAPDVEMRLKFPNSNRLRSTFLNQNQSDSGLGEDNSQDKNIYHFPKIENKKSQMTERRIKTSINSMNESLPKLPKERKSKRRESAISIAHSAIVPRQNKTSTCRYHLSRPRDIYALPDTRQYSELLRRFPEILAVTGRSISPEMKSFDRDF